MVEFSQKTYEFEGYPLIYTDWGIQKKTCWCSGGQVRIGLEVEAALVLKRVEGGSMKGSRRGFQTDRKVNN